jgi:hypothetical protein
VLLCCLFFRLKMEKKILFMLLLLVSVGFGLLGKAFSFWQL